MAATVEVMANSGGGSNGGSGSGGGDFLTMVAMMTNKVR